MNPDSLLRAVAVGAATGSRSFLGLAALTLATPADADGQPDATLAKPWAKGVTSTMALGELVGDKLPQSPSRATWAPLGARLATASGVGALVGRRFGQRAATGDPVSPRPVTDDASQQRQQRSDMVICAAPCSRTPSLPP
ncbi:hypothetical protein [uncultured Jatrophihabitans sp.]|uniref:hypothetical protein n=1 Tax=uncultured Jatrophihabitans sp. TaxID=1610747 RepID=UPI0035CBC329